MSILLSLMISYRLSILFKVTEIVSREYLLHSLILSNARGEMFLEKVSREILVFR